MSAHACACMESKGCRVSLFYHSSFYFLETGLSVTLDYTISQLGPVTLPSPPSMVLGLQVCATTSGFCIGAGDPNWVLISV